MAPEAGHVRILVFPSVVSMTKEDCEERTLVFPAISIRVASRRYDPSERVDGVVVKIPDPFVVPVRVSRIDPLALRTKKVTPAFASPVRVRVGVVSFVWRALLGAVILGAFGAVVSMVRVRGALTVAFGGRASSSLVTMYVVVPSERADPGVQDHVPSACAVVVQRIVPLALRRVIVVPESAVPEKVGVVSLVVLPSFGRTMVGVFGGVASTVKVTLAGVASVFPAASILRNRTVWIALVSPVAVNPVGRHAVHAPASIRHS